MNLNPVKWQSTYTSTSIHICIHTDLYPWLDEKDPSRHITDKEILESTINLSEACLTEKEKLALYKILLKYREEFSN